MEKSAYAIDIIISDWNMPKMTGLELLRQLCTNHVRAISLLLW
ncbi:hypothetical protein [Marinifaba aquimaris]